MKQQLEKAGQAVHIKPLKNIFTTLNSHELIEGIALFLLSRICFMDYLVSPFGIAFYTALFARKKRPYYVIFSILGMASTYMPIFFFKYAGSIAITTSMLLIFSKELEHKKRVVAALATLSVFLNGAIYVITEGFFAFDALLLLLECGITYLSFFVFDKALLSVKSTFIRKTFEPVGIMATIFLFATVVFSVSLTQNFWPIAHMAAIFVILLLSLTFGFGVSTPAGACLGFALCFSTPYPAQMICIYTLSSLFSGLVAQYGRLVASGIFAFSSLTITLLLCPEANGILTVSYVAAACLLLFFVPDKYLTLKALSLNTRKEASAAHKIKDATALKITETMDSINSVGTIFHEVIESLRDSKYDSSDEVFKATADTVCQKCSLCRFCWNKDKDKTRDIAERMLSIMESKNTLSKKDIPKDFSDMCIRADSFVSELNKNYESQKLTKMWAGKVFESKKLIAEQFKNISMILKNLQSSILEKTDFIPEAERRIEAELNRHGISFDKVSVYHKDGYSVTLDKINCDSKTECDTVILNAISEALEVPMVKEPTECTNNLCQIRFSQKTKFLTDIAISGATKKNSAGSGDNALVFPVEHGKIAIVLADGMGSGEMANFQSSIAVKLTKKLLLAGFNKETCLRLINDILMTNADRDTFSTIDLCLLNLYTGEVEFAKAGSANSYIKLQNAYQTIPASSLPAGLVQSIEPDFYKKHISAGDWLVMATDGVTDMLEEDEKNEIFKLLENFDGTAKELSDEILSRALKKSAGTPLDDMTVAVCKISQNI